MAVATELFRRLTQENTYVQEFKACLGNTVRPRLLISKPMSYRNIYVIYFDILSLCIWVFMHLNLRAKRLSDILALWYLNLYGYSYTYRAKIWRKCSCYYPPGSCPLFHIFSDTGELFGKRSLIPAIARNPHSSCSHGSDPFLPLPGPGFGIYAVVHLLLPVMTLWLRRSHKDHSYWDVASANFKHAIGLSCELVVEHIQSFLHSGSYSARASSCGHCCCLQHRYLKVLSEWLM